MGAADLTLRQGAGASLGHRSGSRNRTLHADELRRKSGKSIDKQPHRSRNQHSRIQRGQCSSEGAERSRRQSITSSQSSLRSPDAPGRCGGREQVEASESETTEKQKWQRAGTVADEKVI